MDENALPKPRMPRIKNFPFLGPVGVMLSSCIMTPERISRSTRTAHGLVACNFPLQAILLPSPRSAVCIIAMSAERREIGAAARSRLSPPNCPQFFFEQGQPSILEPHYDPNEVQSTLPKKEARDRGVTRGIWTSLEL
jgi:hypothetical protein